MVVVKCTPILTYNCNPQRWLVVRMCRHIWWSRYFSRFDWNVDGAGTVWLCQTIAYAETSTAAQNTPVLMPSILPLDAMVVLGLNSKSAIWVTRHLSLDGLHRWVWIDFIVFIMEELDALLNKGWFRMRENVFTTHYYIRNADLLSTVWLRSTLANYRFSKSQRSIYEVYISVMIFSSLHLCWLKSTRTLSALLDGCKRW